MAKTAAKKAAPKKAVKKVAASKTAKPAKAASKTAAPKPIKEALSKTGLVAHIAETTQLAPKDVRAVLASLEATAHASLSKKGVGSFVLPGMLKITSVKRAGQAEAQGHQPVHQGRAGVCCQACDLQAEGPCDEASEGRRAVIALHPV